MENNSKLKTQNSKLKTICVIGLGYIGLPTALLLANRGYKEFKKLDIKSDLDFCGVLNYA